MATTLLIWLCTVPLTFALVAPWVGWRAAGLASVAVFGALLPACWALCAWWVSHPTGGGSAAVPSADGSRPTASSCTTT